MSSWLLEYGHENLMFIFYIKGVQIYKIYMIV